MAELANKSFFKFLLGFLAIIATSFLVISATGYLSEENARATAVQEECEETGEC